jgi:hypothetical protein
MQQSQFFLSLEIAKGYDLTNGLHTKLFKIQDCPVPESMILALISSGKKNDPVTAFSCLLSFTIHVIKISYYKP